MSAGSWRSNHWPGGHTGWWGSGKEAQASQGWVGLVWAASSMKAMVRSVMKVVEWISGP